MTVPQSLLLAALAVAWIVLLVPSLTRRRGHVKESVEGSGFRVLSRPPAVGRKLDRRSAVANIRRFKVANMSGSAAGDMSGSAAGDMSGSAAEDRTGNARSEDQMSSQQVDDSFPAAEDDTVVLEPVGPDGAERRRVHAHGSHPWDGTRDRTDRSAADDGADRFENVDADDRATAGPSGADRDDSDDGDAEEAAAHDEHDEAELRRQYQAWRSSTRSPDAEGAESDPLRAEAPEPADVRPIPRRPGRGVYDPEAAERARAYKFARRRRAVLVLTLLIVGFALAAVLISSTLWIGAGLAAAALVLFLTYLRRQVRIEADIRARRLAKLERARQIRPEHARRAAGSAGPRAERGPRPSRTADPVRHRPNRVVLDLDDDDPGFDDLEQYHAMEYRRAVGQ